ncbi:LacI family transcriptional regulator [Cryobacterium lactosi]|uniref:LacI family transcriptional regulator n=1 Tax=Cryobacterium lactosi TaxID=1259202 RepID=A0A4R9BWF0_9MICO|nr:LacI family DNA-binding transcriptional regulator [Cryobacterium lactosi]TFD91549.1 LacI family transcriptional regulator [Cryobacterium lactosi]
MASTLHDVAKLAGVSFKTVSNVVNDYPFVRDQTRSKVLAAIEELDYRPNLQARSLRLGRTGMIGFAVPELSLPYFAELAAQVIEAAQRHDLTVLTEQSIPSRAGELEILSSPRRRMTDGLIFNPLWLEDRDIPQLEAAGPVVLLGEALFPGTMDQVVMRNVEASRYATEYLLETGHKRIAAIGADLSKPGGSPHFRLEGYRQALQAAGIAFDLNLVGEATPWHRLDGARSMRHVLGRGDPPDAVFAFNDTLALGAIHALQEVGLRVPFDVSVVGFDDIEEAQYSFPELTTINPGRSSIAELAVTALARRIADRGAVPHLSEPDFHLVVRKSVMPRSHS